MLWPLDSCHWNVLTEGLEKCQLCGHLRSQHEGKNSWNVSWFGTHAKHLRVMFGGGAFQLSSGKEHGVYLSAGVYLDKQENILPPNLIGTGILLSIWWLKQCRALQNILRSIGFPGSRVCVSAEAHSRSCFCVNRSAAPASMKHGDDRGVDGDIFQGHYLRAILFNTCHVKTVSGRFPELKITPSI